MYTILDNAELLTFDEIKAKYDGKWVFMTNCEFSDGNGLIHAIPRIVADKKWDSYDSGIYDVYDDKEIYGRSTSVTFYDLGSFIGSVTFVPKGGNAVEAGNVHV